MKSEKSLVNPTNEIGIERVNIRPRKRFLLKNLRDNTIKDKIRIWYNNTIFFSI